MKKGGHCTVADPGLLRGEAKYIYQSERSEQRPGGGCKGAKPPEAREFLHIFGTEG